MYLKADRLADVLALKTPWVRVADASGDLASGMGEGADRLPGRPEALLDVLEHAGGQVTQLEQTTLDGAPVRHLRGTIDLADAIASAPGRTGDRLGSGLRSEGIDPSAIHGPVVVELWIDRQDRIRQLHLTATPSAGSDGGATVDATLHVLDPGAPVSIDVPPASQVTDLKLRDLFHR